MNLVAELKWRGMIQDIMPGTEDQLNKEMTTGYIGFDPTSDSLHVGSLVPILLLVHMQRAGHKPIALVGGATGMIGDPSGKSEERSFLSEEQLQINLDGIKKQLSQFLDFDTAKPNAAEMANNYDWFKEISFIQFLRDAGKHITVNYMMAKDSVKKRIEGNTGISYTEFAYQLMQGYDFYWLYQHKNCKLQMGGSDQWGNITTGTEFIRRKASGEAFALTCPLLTKADGTKFGKSEAGNVWLSAEKTSPYQFYQFWLKATDVDAEKWIKIFTFLSQETIDQLIEEHRKDAAAHLLQKTLAKEITVFVHGEAGYQAALEDTKKMFDKKDLPAEALTLEELETMDGIAKFDFELAKVQAGIDVVSFLADAKIFPSKGDARKTVQGNGVSINRKKVTDKFTIDASLLLHGQYLLVQKGKSNFYLGKAI